MEDGIVNNLAEMLIFAALFYAIVSAIATISIIAQGKALSVERYQPDDKLLAILEEVARIHNTWATNNGFVFIGFYRIMIAQSVVFMAPWQRRDRPTVMCLYNIRTGDIRKASTDIVTDFADQITLTSNDSRAAQFSPQRPGQYKQTFSPVTLDELWTKHIEAENYLMDAGGARLTQKEFQLEREIIDSCLKQNAYIRSIPFWYLKGAYWYFIRKNIRHNKSIKQQHEKKMVKLPNELLAIGPLTYQR